MAAFRLALLTLALLTAGATLAAPVTAQDPTECVPTPQSTNPKDLVDYATYVLVFWDPALLDCLDV